EHRKTFSSDFEASHCPHPLPGGGTHSQFDGGRPYPRRLYRASSGNPRSSRKARSRHWRSPARSDLPSPRTCRPWRRTGLRGRETELVIGLVAPARTPPSIVELLARRMAEFVARPQTQERLAVFGFTAVGSTPEEFAAQIKSDVDRAAAVVRKAAIKVD